MLSAAWEISSSRCAMTRIFRCVSGKDSIHESRRESLWALANTTVLPQPVGNTPRSRNSRLSRNSTAVLVIASVW